jgi:hypothetical protein
MTRVSGSGSNPAGQGGLGSSADQGFQTRQQTDTRAAGFDVKKRFDGKAATHAGTADRAAVFQRSIRAAEDKSKDEATSHVREQEDGHVLAVAGGIASGAAMPDPGTVSPGETKSAATLEPVVTEILAKIEQAWRAELSASAEGPASLQIDLGDAIEGLKGLTVTMTGTSLDVILVRGEGEASAELMLAAQVLADRLQQRSGKRIVRVLDAVGSEATGEAEAPGGIQAISGILRSSANKT